MNERDLFGGYGIPDEARQTDEVRGDTDGHRFLREIRREDGHWLWTGRQTRAGHGRFFAAGRWQSAKRFSWAMAHAVAKPHHVIAVTCDQPTCVWPEHLIELTHRESLARNREDRIERVLTPRERAFRERRLRALSTSFQQEEVPNRPVIHRSSTLR